MRLEVLPLVVGLAMGLVGLGLLFDAWAPDDIIVSRERRRRPRMERDRFGEALVGLGLLGIAAAFMGRDSWRYSTVAVIAATLFLLWGTKRNSGYLKGAFARGGAAKPPPPTEGSRRIR